MRTCTVCGQNKPVEAFYVRPNRTNGREPRCKVCKSTYAKSQRATFSSERRENARALSQEKNWKKIGIVFTRAAYAQKLVEQGGVCAICGLPPSVKQVLAVDHCHKSGKIRGLLHNKCNAAIGALGDDPKTVRRAVSYLESYL